MIQSLSSISFSSNRLINLTLGILLLSLLQSCDDNRQEALAFNNEIAAISADLFDTYDDMIDEFSLLITEDTTEVKRIRFQQRYSERLERLLEKTLNISFIGTNGEHLKKDLILLIRDMERGVFLLRETAANIRSGQKPPSDFQIFDISIEQSVNELREHQRDFAKEYNLKLKNPSR